MRFKIADHGVHAAGFQLLRFGQHLVSLAGPGSVAEKYFELAGLPLHHAACAAGFRPGTLGKMRTSMPSASLISLSTELEAQNFHAVFLVWPMNNCVIRCSRAKCMIALIGFSPAAPSI